MGNDGAFNILVVALGAGLGFLIAWLLLRPNAAVLNARLSSLQQELTKVRGRSGEIQRT